MIFIIDTSSFYSLAKYYVAHDRNLFLPDFFKNKMQEGEIIFIDEVYDECLQIQQEFIFKNIPFLKDLDFLKQSRLPINTKSLIAPKPSKFARIVDDHFANKALLKAKPFTQEEYDAHKNKYMNGADAKQIILALNLKQQGKEVRIVTEETSHANDGKMFHKIPRCCKHVELLAIHLPELIKGFYGIEAIYG